MVKHLNWFTFVMSITFTTISMTTINAFAQLCKAHEKMKNVQSFIVAYIQFVCKFFEVTVAQIHCAQNLSANEINENYYYLKIVRITRRERKFIHISKCCT